MNGCLLVCRLGSQVTKYIHLHSYMHIFIYTYILARMCFISLKWKYLRRINDMTGDKNQSSQVICVGFLNDWF